MPDQRHTFLTCVGVLALCALAAAGCDAGSPDVPLRRDAIERLQEGLMSSDVAVRCDAARALLDLGLLGPARDSLAELEATAASEHRVAIWSQLIRADATSKSRDTLLTDLRRVARDEDAPDRGAALVALAAVGETDEAVRLAEGLWLDPGVLGISAAQTLALSGREEGFARLLELLRDGDAGKSAVSDADHLQQQRWTFGFVSGICADNGDVWVTFYNTGGKVPKIHWVRLCVS